MIEKTKRMKVGALTKEEQLIITSSAYTNLALKLGMSLNEVEPSSESDSEEETRRDILNRETASRKCAESYHISFFVLLKVLTVK